MNIDTVKTGPWKQNCFLIYDEIKNAVVIDPGDDAEQIIMHIEERGLQPLAILNTHAHFDHVSAVKAIQQKFNIPFYLHENEIPLLKRANLYRMAILKAGAMQVPTVDHLLTDDTKELRIQNFDFKIHQTPGHTPGGICIEINGHLFVGDTVLESNLIPNHLPEENTDLLKKSIKYLNTLNPNLITMPGHGKPTSLQDQLKLLLELP